jgi:hypothetical protein
MVLRRAIADLLLAGKRVLLVTSTNIAVDNALAGVIDKLKPPAGLLVRVGTPQLPEIARNADVSLSQLKVARCQQVDDRRSAVERRLVELDRVTKHVEDLTTALTGLTTRHMRGQPRCSPPSDASPASPSRRRNEPRQQMLPAAPRSAPNRSW